MIGFFLVAVGSADAGAWWAWDKLHFPGVAIVVVSLGVISYVIGEIEQN
jgi:hypothetical protein